MPDEPAETTIYHHDVFISHAQHDKAVAEEVCSRLEAKNIRCWIAPRDVSPGKEFPEAIVDGIERGRIVVVIFSSHANSSPHVVRELITAVNKDRIIIPFRIENVTPSKSMEYLISVPHWLDAVTPPLETHIDTLIQTIECIIGTGIIPEDFVVKPDQSFLHPTGGEAGTELLPDQTPVQSPAPGTFQNTGHVNTGDRSSGITTKNPPPLKLMAAGAMVIVIIILAIIFSQQGFFSSGDVQPDTVIQESYLPDFGGLSEADYYRSTDTIVNTVALTTAPTRSMTKDTELYLDAAKDMSSAVVTVQFNGGPGTGLVKENRVILTRSDGTVTEGQLDLKERLSYVVLQGSRGTDRIQVIITLHSGEERSIMDKLLPYRQYY